MTNEAAGKVTIVGLDKLLTKLNSKIPQHAKQRLYKKGGEEGKARLSPLLPRRTGTSASHLSLSISSEAVRLSVPAFPLRFLEFGTVTHTGEGQRLHRRRAARVTKEIVGRQGWRIKPRKFMANTRVWIKRQLPRWISAEEKNIESEWSS